MRQETFAFTDGMLMRYGHMVLHDVALRNLAFIVSNDPKHLSLLISNRYPLFGGGGGVGLLL